MNSRLFIFDGESNCINSEEQEHSVNKTGHAIMFDKMKGLCNLPIFSFYIFLFYIFFEYSYFISQGKSEWNSYGVFISGLLSRYLKQDGFTRVKRDIVKFMLTYLTFNFSQYFSLKFIAIIVRRHLSQKLKLIGKRNYNELISCLTPSLV